MLHRNWPPVHTTMLCLRPGDKVFAYPHSMTLPLILAPRIPVELVVSVKYFTMPSHHQSWILASYFIQYPGNLFLHEIDECGQSIPTFPHRPIFTSADERKTIQSLARLFQKS